MIKSKGWNWKMVEDDSNCVWKIPSIESYYLLDRWKGLGFKSFLSILNCFGKKKIKTKLDTNSDKTFIKIKEVVTNIIPLYIIFGNIIIMNKSLTICSDILLITWGIIFSLPKKNPLKILDKESNGNTKEIAKIGR